MAQNRLFYFLLFLSYISGCNSSETTHLSFVLQDETSLVVGTQYNSAYAPQSAFISIRSGISPTRTTLPTRRFVPYRSAAFVGKNVLFGRLDGLLCAFMPSEGRLLRTNVDLKLAGPVVLVTNTEDQHWIAVGQKEAVIGTINRENGNLEEVSRHFLRGDPDTASSSVLMQAAYVNNTRVLFMCFDNGRCLTMKLDQDVIEANPIPQLVATKDVAGISSWNDSFLIATIAGEYLSVVPKPETGLHLVKVLADLEMTCDKAFCISPTRWIAEAWNNGGREVFVVDDGKVKQQIPLNSYRLVGINGANDQMFLYDDKLGILEVQSLTDGSVVKRIDIASARP